VSNILTSLESALDRLVFAGAERAIRDVVVGGRWVVRDGRHALDELPLSQFAVLMKRLSREAVRP
jgi:formimidoylglutamate deiminase